MNKNELIETEMDILKNRILELEKLNKSFTHSLENIKDGFYSVDKNWNYIYLNDIALKTVNKTHDELIGLNMWESFPMVKEHPFYHAYHEAMEKQHIIEIESYYPHLERWFNVRICPSDDSLSVFYIDTTEKNEKKLELINSETKLAIEKEKFNSLLDNAPAIIGMTEGPEHRFVYANNPYRNLIGKMDFLGKPIREVRPDLESQGFIDLLNNVYSTGKPFIGNELPLLIDKTGSGVFAEIFVNLKYEPIFGINNKIEGLSFFAFEVTDHVLARKKVESFMKKVSESEIKYKVLAESLELVVQQRTKEVKSEKENLHFLLMNAPSVICVLKGPEHIYEFANKDYSALYGNRPLLGRTIREASPELENQGFFELLDNVYRTGEPFLGSEIPANIDQDSNGIIKKVYFNFVYNPIFNKDGIVEGIAIFAFDITKQVLTRHEVEKLNEQLMISEAEHKTLNAQLSVSEAEFRNLSESLELKVQERTTELLEAHKMAEYERNKLNNLFMNAPAIIFVMEGPEHVFTLSNPNYQKLVGNRDILGKTIREAYPEFEDQRLFERLDNVYKSGEPFIGNEIPVSLRNNGVSENKYRNFVYQPVFNSDNQVEGISVFGFDVTEQVVTRKKLEILTNELMEKTTILESILDSVGDGIIVADENGKFLVFNPAAEKILGIEATDKKLKKWTELYGTFLPDTITPFLAEDLPLVRAIHGESVDKVEMFIRNENNLDGKFISLTGRPLKDKEGNLKGGVIAFLDITEKKTAELLLQKSELFNRDALNSIPSHVAILDANGNIINVNEAWNKFALENGGNPDKLGVGINYLNVHREARVDSNEISEQVLAGIQKVISGSDNNFSIEYPCHSPTEERWFVMNVSPLTGNEGVLISHLNITEQKLSEKKLYEHAALLDITTDAIIVMDLKDNIIYCNKGAEALYDHKKEELLGNKLNEILYKENSSDFEQKIKDVIKNGIWEGEFQYITKNKKEITVESAWNLMTDNTGNPVSILIVSSDITKRKIIEAEYLRTQRLESIGILASGIAHDLNNVLTPMMFSTEILKMRIKDEKGLRLIESMNKSTKHGAELVKQLLIFAKGIEVKHSPLDLRVILEEVKQIIDGLLPKNIDIITEIPEDLKTIIGDKTQLNQVIMNLLVNARDAMLEGGIIRISGQNIYLDQTFVQMNRDAKTGHYVMFSVSDTGSGIPKSILDKIFEPFFTTKGIGKGTGLGLSTTIGIIKSHGGFINVISKEGTGTDFKIYLPSTSDTDSKILNLDVIGQNFKGNGETILLIEDEDSIIETITQTLEVFNYKVLTAYNGVEGISVYVQNKEKISLVITDILLPLMDGHQTVKAILKVNPDEKFIVISGHEQSDKIQQVGKQIKFISKPFTANILLASIHEQLNT